MPGQKSIRLTMQPSTRFNASEDCLIFNLFTPSNATTEAALPLMYVIQRGGFQSNSNPSNAHGDFRAH